MNYLNRVCLIALALLGAAGCNSPGVESSALSEGSSLASASVSAQIRILDQNGAPVANANVSGLWSGAVSGAASATTDANGIAVFQSAQSASPGSYTLTVQNVSKSGWSYDSARNRADSASVTR